jgi:hypothetical protein
MAAAGESPAIIDPAPETPRAQRQVTIDEVRARHIK